MSTLRVNTLQTTDSAHTVNVADLQAGVDFGNQIGNRTDPAKGAELVGFNGRSVRSKLLESASVLDFGAKGDGITDDTAAIQAAYDALPSAGGVLYFPPGRFYRMDGTITLTKAVHVRGDGPAVATIARVSGANSAFFILDSQDASVSDIRFLGIGGAASTTATYALRCTANASNAMIERVKIANVASGILMNAALFTVRGVDITGLKPNFGVGIQVDQGAGGAAGSSLIDDLKVRNAGGADCFSGVTVLQSTDLEITNSKLLSTGTGILISPATGQTAVGIKISDLVANACKQGGVLLSNNGAGSIARVSISHSTLYGSSSGSGVRVATGSTVSGLRISDSELYANINGILLEDNTIFSNLDIEDNILAGNTTTDIALGANTVNFNITGNRTGSAGGYFASANGVFISAGCQAYSVIGNTLHNLSDASYPSQNLSIANNRGWGTASMTYDAASIAAGAGFTGTMGLTGARAGDEVTMTYRGDLLGLTMTAWVQASDVVAFRLQNGTGAAIDLASGIFRARIARYS